MYLVYIYNNFILNVLLTFLLFLTFIYVVISFKSVLRHLCESIKELHMSGKTCLRPWHAEEPNMAKQFGESLLADLVQIYCIYICLFWFDASTKKLFVSFHYHVLFFCLAAVVVQVNTVNNTQYLWLFLDIQIKYS